MPEDPPYELRNAVIIVILLLAPMIDVIHYNTVKQTADWSGESMPCISMNIDFLESHVCMRPCPHKVMSCRVPSCIIAVADRIT